MNDLQHVNHQEEDNRCKRCQNGVRCTRCGEVCQNRIPAEINQMPFNDKGIIGYAPRDICSCEFVIVRI